MEKIIKLNTYSLIGDELCISPDEGDVIYNLIMTVFENNKKVILSFLNIELITPAFLNASIGKLYEHYNPIFIEDNLQIVNISDGDKLLLDKVKETAINYYNNPDYFEKSFRDILKDCENK